MTDLKIVEYGKMSFARLLSAARMGIFTAVPGTFLNQKKVYQHTKSDYFVFDCESIYIIVIFSHSI